MVWLIILYLKTRFYYFPEMFVLCNIYYFRNPVGLVLVLAGIIESWTGHYQHLWGFLVLLMLRLCGECVSAQQQQSWTSNIFVL